MKHPLDSSDEASLILADYLEEYDDINLANEIRSSVLEPNINNWCWESNYYGGLGGFSGVWGGGWGGSWSGGVFGVVGFVGFVGDGGGVGTWGGIGVGSFDDIGDDSG